MTKILTTAACILFAAAALPAQSTTKTASTGAGLGKPGNASNEDANIRAYVELLRADLKTTKAKIMGDVMQLDTDQATKFWPIYKEFETEYTTLGNQIAAAVKNYADHYRRMTDAVADQLGSQVLSIEEQRNVLKKKYYGRMKGSLGAITATRFLQVENQLERLVDLQIAAQLPVIGER